VTKPALAPTRRIAIDPGSAHLGVVVSEGDAPPLRLLYRATLDVGEMRPLAKPKTGTRRDGTPWTMTHRRSVTSEHVAMLCLKVLDICREHDVTRGITEHVEHVFLDPEKTIAAHRSQATALSRSSWVAGEIRGTLRAAGIEMAPGVPQASARARVVGRKKGVRGGSSPERIPEAVRRGFVDWPAEAGEHERDAAVLALYDATPVDAPPPVVPGEPAKPRKPRVKKAPELGPDGEPVKPKRKPRPPRQRPAWKVTSRLPLQALPLGADRRARGCTCPSVRGRCRRDCPLFGS